VPWLLGCADGEDKGQDTPAGGSQKLIDAQKRRTSCHGGIRNLFKVHEDRIGGS